MKQFTPGDNPFAKSDKLHAAADNLLARYARIKLERVDSAKLRHKLSAQQDQLFNQALALRKQANVQLIRDAAQWQLWVITNINRLAAALITKER